MRSFPGNTEDRELSEKMCSILSTLLLVWKIEGETDPIKEVDAGAEGFKYMEEGKIRGKKIEYEVIRELIR